MSLLVASVVILIMQALIFAGGMIQVRNERRFQKSVLSNEDALEFEEKDDGARVYTGPYKDLQGKEEEFVRLVRREYIRDRKDDIDPEGFRSAQEKASFLFDKGMANIAPFIEREEVLQDIQDYKNANPGVPVDDKGNYCPQCGGS